MGRALDALDSCSRDSPTPAGAPGARLSLATHELGIAAEVMAALSWRIQACRSASQQHDVRGMLSVILDSAASIVACDAAGVYVFDSKRLRVKHRLVRGYQADVAKDAIPAEGDGPVGRVLLTGQPARVDVQSADTIAGRPSTRARVVVPVIGSRGFVLGALDLLSDWPGRFDDFAVDLLTVFAAAVASSIDSARLYHQMTMKDQIDRDLGIAREIIEDTSSSLNAQPPGFDVHAVRETSLPIGGDYCELLPLDRHRWAVVVADVSGKGVSAALLVSATRAIVRSSIESNSTAQETVSRVNRFFRSCGGGLFVTLFYGVLDVQDRTLRYVNAGHHPPILIRASGDVDRLDTAGIPLGLFDAGDYEEGRVRLEPNDVLTLYTDGIVESTNTFDEQFDIERLIALLRGAGAGQSHSTTRQVFAALADFGGDAVRDDRTLVVIRAKTRASSR